MNDFAPLDGPGSSSSVRTSRSRRVSSPWEPITPVPDDAMEPPQAHPRRGRPSVRWAYRDQSGKILMYIFRFDKVGGGKDILPLAYCTNDDVREWRWKGLATPRPLYNLDELYARPKCPVLVVEGEKAADAAKELFPEFVVTTWPNGSKAVTKSDWSPLARRAVTLWPDADVPGTEAMNAVARCLEGVSVASVNVVVPYENVPVGWDAADAIEEIKSGDRKRNAVLSLVVNAKPYEVTGNSGGTKTDSDKEGNNPKRPAVGELLDAVGELELWHTPTGEAWSTVWNGKGFANYSLSDPRFETWIVHRCIGQGHDAPGREALGKLLATMQARAVYDGPEHKVHIRVAGELSEAVYLDMGGSDWKALKITSSGWKEVERPPVKFRRGSGMLPLPSPDIDGSIDDLRSWINCQSEDDWMLCLAWIMTALCPEGPFPILVLSGPPGAAKSTTSKIIRALVDPSTVPLSRVPKDPRDLFASVENSRVLAYDNISKIPAWLSDDLCMIATGSGVRERQFHTNTGEILIEGGCPIIVNGIGDLATRSDLASRSLLVNLSPPTIRRAEFRDTTGSKALWPEFDAARPRLMGGLLGVFCAAMKHFAGGQNTPTGNPRMMDFAIWANAVGVAMGWGFDSFDEAYKGNRSEADEVALEDCPIWEHLQAVFPVGAAEWKGSATDLKNKFLAVIDGVDKRKKMNSMQPSTLAGHIQRTMPLLNKLGWIVVKSRSRTSRTWVIKPPEKAR